MESATLTFHVFTSYHQNLLVVNARMATKNDSDNEPCAFDGLLKMYYEPIEALDSNDVQSFTKNIINNVQLCHTNYEIAKMSHYLPQLKLCDFLMPSKFPDMHHSACADRFRQSGSVVSGNDRVKWRETWCMGYGR